MATGTWPNINLVDPDERAFTLHMVDASGDLWTERLVVALTATLSAIQAWIGLYQALTQSSVYAVTEENVWEGEVSPVNADFLARFGGEAGINMSFRDTGENTLLPIRIVSPQPITMVGENDIPNPDATAMVDFIAATSALTGTYTFRQAQYTVRRERKGNPRVS